MSRSSRGQIPGEGERAVALQYSPGNGAPVIVASGMGHLAEKIVEVAVESGVPVYEDNSLATGLSQMELGREIPEELYQASVEMCGATCGCRSGLRATCTQSQGNGRADCLF